MKESGISGQRSALSGQRSAGSAQRAALSGQRAAVLHLAGALALLVGAAAVAGGANFLTIDGQTVSGELVSADAGGVLTVKTEKDAARKIPADELIRIEFTSDREPDEPGEGVVVHLPGGDRICGALAGSSQTNIEVQSACLGRIRLPLEKLVAVEFRRAGEAPKNAEELRAGLLGNKTKDDIAVSTNGDQMPGIVVGFDADKVVLKTALGEMPLQFNRLFGLAFAARKATPAPPNLLAIARGTDGSIVTGTLAESQDGKVVLNLLCGVTVELAASRLVDVGFKQGKMVYLSDLNPTDEKYTPYFTGDHTWPYQRDRNYDRKAMRLGDKTYRKGIGTFSGTVLTYGLGGQFRKFVALVGIDEVDVNDQGNVTVRVLADGKELFKKADITRKGGPVKVEVALEGVKTLQLAVDFGENMHFGDITDWADAHLIR